MAPTTVRVLAPTRQVSTPFGSVAGIAEVPITAAAEATVTPGGLISCGLCVIGTGKHDIQNGNIKVDGANVVFNGSVEANPQGSIEVTGAGKGISVQGSVSEKGTFTPTPASGSGPVPDPLSFLALPPNMSGLSKKSGDACTNGPGIYYSTFSLSTCTLQPGLYVLAGGSVDHYSGGTAVKANGVTMYFTCAAADKSPRECAAGESGAGILLTGNASLTINAPSTGATKGIAMVADRHNTATWGFRGNGSDPSSGTLYAASGGFDYRGNGNGPQLDSLIVVEDITFSGNNATLSSQYTKEKNLGMLPVAPHLSK